MGNVYVADMNNHQIRKVTPSGDVSTFVPRFFTTDNPGGFPAGFDELKQPGGVAVDASDNVYVANTGNRRILKVTPAGVVSTLAGSGTAGFTNGNATSATFNGPWGVTVDAAGNVYVADANNNAIRKVTPGGTVTTLAASGQFSTPLSVAVDAAGNVFVADFNNHRIRKVTPGGVVSTLAGTGAQGFLDGSTATSQFDGPAGVAGDGLDNVYVAKQGNHRIRPGEPPATAHPNLFEPDQRHASRRDGGHYLWLGLRGRSQHNLRRRGGNRNPLV